MTILISYLWIIPIFFMLIGFGHLVYRFKVLLPKHPELKPYYYFSALFYLAHIIPAVCLKRALSLEGIAEFKDLFIHLDVKPNLAYFWYAIAGLLVLNSIWVLFLGGAEIVSKDRKAYDAYMEVSIYDFTPKFVRIQTAIIVGISLLFAWIAFGIDWTN